MNAQFPVRGHVWNAHILIQQFRDAQNIIKAVYGFDLQCARKKPALFLVHTLNSGCQSVQPNNIVGTFQHYILEVSAGKIPYRG